jgi:hypothetical protein
MSLIDRAIEVFIVLLDGPVLWLTNVLESRTG